MLEQEIKKFTEELYEETFGNGQNTPDEFDWDDIASVIEDTAKHFAEWGAEHFRNTTKMIDEGLEEAADKYSFKYSDFDTEDCEYNVYDHEKREAFIAGAEWKEVQDQKTIELAEDHAMLAGMNKMEQQMMEKAVEKYVHELYTDEEGYHCYISLGTEYAPGDKVRVIVIKEN